MKNKYECDFCYHQFYDEKECRDHEKICHKNIKTKSCETCCNHDTTMGDTGKVWNTCSKNLIIDEGKWIKNGTIQNCNGWECIGKKIEKREWLCSLCPH